MTESIRPNIWYYAILLIFLIIGVLVILPAFQKAKDEGPGFARVMCKNNIRQLALASIIYHDEQNHWPDRDQWSDLIEPYVGSDEPFYCLKDTIGPCSYAMNANIPADANELPGDLVLLFESAPGWNRIGGPDDVITNRHGRPGANIAFADGHVEFVEAEDIPSLRWTVEGIRDE